MKTEDPLALADNEPFTVGRSTFRYYHDLPSRIRAGAFLLCLSGKAHAAVNLHEGDISAQTMLLLMPGSILLFTEVSDDFELSYCAFSNQLFIEAGFRLEPSFFKILSDNPISKRTQVDNINHWLQMAAFTYADRENIYRYTIMKNRLQNVFLEIYDKIQRQMNLADEGNSRQQEIFHRFAELVHEYCGTERQVAFYADKLCITTRYLSTITRNILNVTPKQMIDRMVLLEIKMLLQSTDLSVQEIADRLHFADQSYLGRYFKKYTGLSPVRYRDGYRFDGSVRPQR